MTRFEDMLDRIGACRICRDRPVGKPLPHEPRPVLQASRTARILIAGQAPGIRVHASGRPFTDPSGVRLREWLGVDEKAFYDERNFAIIPMGFCFPGLDDYSTVTEETPIPPNAMVVFKHTPKKRNKCSI